MTQIICPTCQSPNCTRNHEPAKFVGDGQYVDKKLCSSCNEWQVLKISDNGELLCNKCAGTEQSLKLGLCGICDTSARIKLNRTDGIQVGECCYHRPVETCKYCGKEDIVKIREESKPVCPNCYITYCATWENCTECSEQEPVTYRHLGDAKCGSCYEKKYKPKQICGVCGEDEHIKVSQLPSDVYNGRYAGLPECKVCYEKRRYVELKNKPKVVINCCRCPATDITSYQEIAEGHLCEACHKLEQRKRHCGVCEEFELIKLKAITLELYDGLYLGLPECIKCYEKRRYLNREKVSRTLYNCCKCPARNIVSYKKVDDGHLCEKCYQQYERQKKLCGVCGEENLIKVKKISTQHYSGLYVGQSECTKCYEKRRNERRKKKRASASSAL